MKKPTIKQRRFQAWKSAHAMRLLQNSKPRKLKNKRRNAKGTELVIAAPSHFVLISQTRRQNGSDVRKYFVFLSELRAVNAPEVVIDMSGVRRMVVDAALLFKAELSRLVQTHAIRIKAIPPASSRTQQVLKQTGIDRLLNLSIDVLPEHEDVVHWRIAEGPRNKVDPMALEPILADIEELTGLATHPVYQGIIESMGNCVEHAYKDHPEVNRRMPVDPGWWVFQQVKDERLFVVVCDLGIGINRALPLTLANEQGLLRKLMHVVRRAKGEDNRALLAAMEYGRSSTGLHERGRGMRNAHAVVDDHGEGDFYAISNRGCYVYRKTRTEVVGKNQTVKLRHSINGTILGWSLPLTRTPQESLS